MVERSKYADWKCSTTTGRAEDVPFAILLETERIANALERIVGAVVVDSPLQKIRIAVEKIVTLKAWVKGRPGG